MSPERRGVQLAEALRKRFGMSDEHVVGLRFAVNVFLAATIIWFTLRAIHDSNPIWAIASMIAACEPDPEESRRLFKSRLINVLVGCAMGLLSVSVGGRSEWMLPLILAVTVLISAWLIKVRTMWRQAPITAAVVVAACLTSGSAELGIEKGLHKVAEVIFGSLVGMLVSWFTARYWLLDVDAAGDRS